MSCFGSRTDRGAERVRGTRSQLYRPMAVLTTAWCIRYKSLYEIDSQQSSISQLQSNCPAGRDKGGHEGGEFHEPRFMTRERVCSSVVASHSVSLRDRLIVSCPLHEV